jgi:hypothetical protein
MFLTARNARPVPRESQTGTGPLRVQRAIARAAAALAVLSSLGPSCELRASQPPKTGRAAFEITSEGLVVSVRARAIAPGEVVRILVRPAGSAKGPSPTGAGTPSSAGGAGAGSAPLASVSGTFLGETLSFASTGEGAGPPTEPGGAFWSAWTVVGFDEKAGPRQLTIEAKDGSGKLHRVAREVRIAAKSFPTEKLTVKEQYVEPPPEVAERIAAETKRLGAIYASRSPMALQQTPFGRPVPGGSARDLRRTPDPERQAARAAPGTRPPRRDGDARRLAGPGRIALADDLYFSGNTVIVDHGEGLFTIYAHLSRIDVHDGDVVAEGAPIGLSGATGRVTGPHLHWGAKIGDRPFDPTALLDRALFP